MVLIASVQQAAATLIVDKKGVSGLLYDEQAVLPIVAETIKQAFDDGRIISERLNDAGYQTKAGKAWIRSFIAHGNVGARTHVNELLFCRNYLKNSFLY